MNNDIVVLEAGIEGTEAELEQFLVWLRMPTPGSCRMVCRLIDMVFIHSTLELNHYTRSRSQDPGMGRLLGMT